jgi:3-deoxy-manno-octulosonate cytidylyltransferase (CMP-KDO synthetase)
MNVHPHSEAIMKNIIIIPARYNSSRFPGKPLTLIKGQSLIKRVWNIAKAVTGIDEVYIATDDPRIVAHAREFSAKVIMTGECANGTERIFQAVNQLPIKPDFVVNLQGDAVLTPPWVIQPIIDVMLKNPEVELATPAALITQAHYLAMQAAKLKGEVGGTMVVCDKKQNALYFSKSMIPYLRETKTFLTLPLYQHIGVYAYRYATLKEYMRLEPSPLEILEGLEQLRALENGIPMRVAFVDYRGRTPGSIDSPPDVARAEEIIEKEGELI